jgi:hypothetical protein
MFKSSRRVRLLRAHGLIEKVPKAHRYLVTDHGRKFITAMLAARNANTVQPQLVPHEKSAQPAQIFGHNVMISRGSLDAPYGGLPVLRLAPVRRTGRASPHAKSHHWAARRPPGSSNRG